MNASSVSPERCEIDRRVAGVGRHLHGFQRFGQGADLVDLDQNRIGDARLDAARQALGVGDEQIVADQLDLRRRACRS